MGEPRQTIGKARNNHRKTIRKQGTPQEKQGKPKEEQRKPKEKQGKP